MILLNVLSHAACLTWCPQVFANAHGENQNVASESSSKTCLKCKKDGELLCCDGCTNAFHQSCVGLAKLPAGEWFCKETGCSQGLASKCVDDKENTVVEKPTFLFPPYTAKVDGAENTPTTTSVSPTISSKPTPTIAAEKKAPKL